MPDRVDLSIDEAKALFKVRGYASCLQQRSIHTFVQTLLREKDVNPLHPWDTSLPLFINDPRYVLLPSVSARKEAFDEYCRDRARELRQSNVKKEKETTNPKEEFERLLRDEVKSTRTSWTEWRRQWKKDRRFYGWGRDDREREKRFREHLKELGESEIHARELLEHTLIVPQRSVLLLRRQRRTSSRCSRKVVLLSLALSGKRYDSPLPDDRSMK